MLEAAERFVTEVRALCAQDLSDDERWTRTGELMRNLVADPAVQQHARNWPATDRTSSGRDRTGNLLFYEDPDHGFIVSAMAKEGGHRSSVHDHGRIWTLYGLVEGSEEINRYRRTRDDYEEPVEVVQEGSFRIEVGDVDVVPPFQAHQEITVGERSVAVIVRSERPGEAVQHNYNLETGEVRGRAGGPEMIPYKLESPTPASAS